MTREEFTLFNPWWQYKEAINYDATLMELSLQKYQYYHPLFFKFPKKEDVILTLRGPRQVGKSTFIKLLIKELLLHDSISPLNIFFYPADRVKDYNELFNLILDYLTILRGENEKRAYIFIDEISIVKEWQRAIKQLADLGRFRNATLLLTGSNALDLLKSSELLPGRKGKYILPEIDFLPLSFKEFVELIKPEWRQKSSNFYQFNLNKLHKLFLDYLVTGGFPKSINEYFATNTLLPSTFKTYESWVVGDLLKIGKNEETAINILKRLFLHLTSTFSFYTLAEKGGISSHMTVVDYLDALEKMFVVFKLPYFSLAERKSYPQKNKKAYFYDPLIYNTFRAVAESYLDAAINYIRQNIVIEVNLPLLVENAVAVYLKQKFQKLYFGRLGDKEVDFLTFHKGKYHFFEVKYQDKVAFADFSFWLRTFPKQKLTIVTKNFLYQKKTLQFVPLELFLLECETVA